MNITSINDLLAGELRGDCPHDITGAEQIQKATAQQITFIGDRSYIKYWATSQAGAAIVSRELADLLEPGEGRALIVVANADLAMAILLEAMEPAPPSFEHHIHPTAVIHHSATIGDGVKIGA
ncbi:MAG: LpxD N-terminal domain-containing protein, partial [Bacteroidota bacterium]